MYGSNCKGAEEEGVSILHGNRGVYHDDKQPAFKVVYDAIHNVSNPGGSESYVWIMLLREIYVLTYIYPYTTTFYVKFIISSVLFT